MTFPRRGEIWWVNFEPAVGTEIKKIRPALIVSNNIANSQEKRFTIIPLTSKISNSPITVLVSANNENGLEKDSTIRIPDIVTFDKKRIKSKIGLVDKDKLKEVELKIKRHLGLV